MERTNKTLKEILHKLMTEKKSKDWPDLMSTVQKVYNNTYHSLLKHTPHHYFTNNLSSVDAQLVRASKWKEDAKEKPLFVVGDVVRRVMRKRTFDKSYTSNYSLGTYEVVQVFVSDIPQYKIKNRDTILSPIFHNWDLVKS